MFPYSPDDFDCTMNRWSNKLAPHESETKDDYAWRAAELENCENFLVDVHDKFNWEQATILKTRENSTGDRPFIEAYVAFRIYNENGKKIEETTGKRFDGWTAKFDEWIPIYSPRIQKFDTHAK